MITCIVDESEPVTLLGGGVAAPGDVAEALALAPTCVAADGGLRLARAAGIDPVAVIGDFDSVAPEDLAQVPPDRQHRIAEQDSTDFDKALRHIRAPVVLAVGFAGARMDHQLAALHVLVAHADRPCILLAEREIILHCPPRLTLPTRAGEIVSLFPMAPVAGTSAGLRWPVDGLAFAPDRLVGTSNVAEGPVTLTMETPGMLAIIPRGLLPAATAALAQDAPRWPARAGRYRDPPRS